MGGSGSEKSKRFAPRVSDFLALNITDFKMSDFQNGETGRYLWTVEGAEIASVTYRINRASITLDYLCRVEEISYDITQQIALTFTQQPFGGYRRWFVCGECQGMCRILLGAIDFRCRSCREATYLSQYERVHIDELVLAERSRKRLGAEPGFIDAFPQKPVGMHWQTYIAMKKRDRLVVNRLEHALMSA